MKTKLGKMLALALIVALAVPIPVAGQGQAAPPAAPAAEITWTGGDILDLSAALRMEDGRVRVIIQLADPSLAEYTGGVAGLAATSPQALGGGKLDATSAASQAYIAYLVAQQDLVTKDLKALAPSLTVDASYQAVFNGIAGAVSEEEAQRLVKAKGVANVFPDELRHATMDVSLDLINAPEMWAALPGGTQATAGLGIKVAIVDSGLQADNPMFDGDGFVMPPGYPRGYCVTNPSDPDFQCNNKIIAARYFTPTFAVAIEEGPPYSPRGVNGHGSHTAGTSVGNEVTIDLGDGISETISGVAPAAYLMVYKGLFELPDYSNSSGSDTMLVAMLNAAVLDGADVINNSWGGGAGSAPTTPYTTLIPAIVAAGVLPVFSAGNSGPGAGTIGCPGCVEAALTVGASTTSRVHAQTMDVTGPGTVPANLLDMAVAPSNSIPITTTLSDDIAYAGVVDPGNELGCDPFPANAFLGEIALVSRGTCNFTVKIENAEDAGAIALIIHNNGGGPPNIIGTAELSSIPVVSMALSDAQQLVSFIQAHPNDTTVSIDPEISRIVKPEWEDILASFSSIGPNGDPDVLKPDIVAPGVNILSAYSPELPGGGEFAFLQGTSMSAPHVTGGAALMTQLHPNWTPNQIKTALTSTADPTVLLKPNGFQPADALDQGAGRMDLNNAIDAAMTFSRSSMAENGCFQTCSWVRTMTNTLGDAFTFTSQTNPGDGMTLTVQPTSLNLAAGATGTFTVTANLAGAELSVWHFGDVTWTGGGASPAHLPVAAFAVSGTALGTLSKTASEEVVGIGQTYTYTIDLTNLKPVTATFNLTDTIPPEVSFVGGSETGGLVYNPGPETVTATVELGPVLLDVALDTSIDAPVYVPLSGTVGVTSLCEVIATVDCDESAAILTLGAGDYFEYLGATYTQMVLSSNGFVVYGNSTAGFVNAWLNQNMPSATTPNNVLAGIWTDLDMNGDFGADPGGGDWLMNDMTVDSVDYFVIEYLNAEVYQDAASNYTFQFWFEYNSPNVWIVYEDLNGTNTVFTAGAENSLGTVGESYYYDGAGTLPVEGDRLTVNGAIDTHQMTYAVTVNAGVEPGTLIKNHVTATSSADPGVVYHAIDDVLVAFLEIFLPAVFR